jgi:hypothetical protein
MPYTHFRYIAYQVPTAAMIHGKVLSRFSRGKTLDTPILLGSDEKLNIDSRARIRRLLNVMIDAHELIKDNDNDSILKIFMAPEFYFRPNSTDAAYSYDTYRAIKNCLRETIAADSRFNDWLVIPGTIIWKWDKTTGKRPPHGGTDVYMNSTLYIKHGVKSRVIEKTQSSGIDGKPDETGIDRKYSDVVWGDYYKSEPKRKKHFFTIGTIGFGLEICLEHHLKILKDSLTIAGYPAGVAIQLLTAGGMPTERGSVVGKVDGYILRNDGFKTEGLYADPEIPPSPLELANRDRIEDDDKPGFVAPVPDRIHDFTNMRRINKYRKFSATPGGAIEDCAPGVADFCYLTTVPPLNDVEIASSSHLFMMLPTDFVAGAIHNASQRIRIFGRYLIPG